MNSKTAAAEDMAAEQALPRRLSRRAKWAAGGIGLLGAVLCAWIWLLSGMPLGHQVVATMALGSLLVLLSFLWLLAFSRGRMLIVGILFYPLVIGGLIGTFQFERFSGDFVPTLTFRWKKKKHELLAESAPLRAPTDQAPANLAATTPFDYPRFLGSDGRATVTNVTLQRDWVSHPPKLMWKQPIGAGWSSFAVVGPYALTQELRGTEEMITCYRVESGELVWSYVDPLVTDPFLSRVAGDGPRGTPTIHEGLVYALGSTGVLNCLDGATGQKVWSREVLREHGAENTKWGISCSPLVYRDRVVVTCGESSQRSLAAYDRLTGQDIAGWKGGTASNSDAYCSPMLAALCGVEQILILSDDRAAGHDVATGEELWMYPWPSGSPNVAQLVPLPGDKVFVTAGYSKGCVLLQLKRESDKFLVEPAWKLNKNLKSKFSNVVVYDNHVYGFDEGVFVCVNLADGKRAWRGGRYGHGQVLLVGGLIVLQQEDPGDLLLIEPTPEEPREIARIPALEMRTWNNPVISGQYLLIRNDREAACFKVELVEEPVSEAESAETVEE
ncbi:MAG: PQQ-binding-like beta-propeller repeat protein [Pirellulales bacterium]